MGSSSGFKARLILQSGWADFVCLVAVSTAKFDLLSALADFVCLLAVSTAEFDLLSAIATPLIADSLDKSGKRIHIPIVPVD